MVRPSPLWNSTLVGVTRRFSIPSTGIESVSQDSFPESSAWTTRSPGRVGVSSV